MAFVTARRISFILICLGQLRRRAFAIGIVTCAEARTNPHLSHCRIYEHATTQVAPGGERYSLNEPRRLAAAGPD